MPRIPQLLVLMLMATLGQATDAFAQGSSLFGNNGPSGNSGFGGNPSGLTPGTAPGTGGATGSGGLGGAGGAGANLGATQNAFGTQPSGFVGRADTSGRFVGNAQAGTQNNGSNGNGRFNISGGQPGFERGNNGFNRSNSLQRTSTIRPQQRIAFEFNPIKVAESTKRLQVRYEKLAVKIPRFQAVRVIREETVLVLQGEVESEADWKIAEMFARQEPGVREVRNELVVRSADSDALSESPAE